MYKASQTTTPRGEKQNKTKENEETTREEKPKGTLKKGLDKLENREKKKPRRKEESRKKRKQHKKARTQTLREATDAKQKQRKT